MVIIPTHIPVASTAHKNCFVVVTEMGVAASNASTSTGMVLGIRGNCCTKETKIICCINKHWVFFQKCHWNIKFSHRNPLILFSVSNTMTPKKWKISFLPPIQLIHSNKIPSSWSIVSEVFTITNVALHPLNCIWDNNKKKNVKMNMMMRVWDACGIKILHWLACNKYDKPFIEVAKGDLVHALVLF